MKKLIYLSVCLLINFLSAQTKSSDYFSFYKGGEKYLKPVKYLLFDSNVSDNKKVEDKERIYFQIKKEQFKFDSTKNINSSYTYDILEKVKFEDPEKLESSAYKFFKKKKEEVEKEKKIKLVFPPAGYHSYYKIYILEKVNKNKIIMYEVSWINSTF